MSAEKGGDAKIVAIVGPTASGKTALALDLASMIPLEVISADSMQIYRGMDIGTDKPSKEDMERVPHHLVDIKYPDEPWSVEEFQARARAAAAGIRVRGALPCVVGGTGLYVRALVRDYPLVEAPPDPDFRREMAEMARRRGNEAVHSLLREVDPVSWRVLHPNDLKRVVRALEYYRATGRPISERRAAEGGTRFSCLIIGILRDRQELGERIDNRVEIQFARGFVDEVRRLLSQGYSDDLPSMQGLGYKEICQFLRGFSTLDETKYLIKRNTRRLAKRQMTWFSREEGMNWIRAGKDTPWTKTVDAARQLITEFLEDV